MSVSALRLLFCPGEISRRKTNAGNRSKQVVLVEGGQILEPSYSHDSPANGPSAFKGYALTYVT